MYIKDWCVLHYILSAVFNSQYKVNTSTARPNETLVSECIYVVHIKREFAPVHALKAYRGIEVQLHSFLTLVLVGGEWSASCPTHFTLGEITWAPFFRRLYGPWRKCG
jgi:hypothetical protein